MAARIDPDTLHSRLEKLIDSGDMTDAEARHEWMAAEEEAMDAEREEWNR